MAIPQYESGLALLAPLPLYKLVRYSCLHALGRSPRNEVNNEAISSPALWQCLRTSAVIHDEPDALLLGILFIAEHTSSVVIYN